MLAQLSVVAFSARALNPGATEDSVRSGAVFRYTAIEMLDCIETFYDRPRIYSALSRTGPTEFESMMYGKGGTETV